jgi:group I intron endonuclease
MRKSISGVYCIENRINNKKYVGCSMNIEKRWMVHFDDLNSTVYSDTRLKMDIHNCGITNFNFYILEECPPILLGLREDYYIVKYDTLNPEYGYNMIRGGYTFLEEKGIFKNVEKIIEQLFIICTQLSRYKQLENKSGIESCLAIISKVENELLKKKIIIIKDINDEDDLLKISIYNKSRFKRNPLKKLITEIYVN